MLHLHRRDFLAISAAAVAAGAMGVAARGGAQPAGDGAKGGKRKLKLLFLGGTAFTGPELCRMAVDRGHSVTIFNRGKTEKRIGGIPDEVERLVGDRDPKKDTGLAALQGDRKWDAVIDLSGQYPRHVKASAELLAPRIGQYIFISSVSAYKQPLKPHTDETAPTAELSDPNVEEMGKNFENYSGLKAACERAAEAAMPGKTANVRPGLIVGPGDQTDRFTYWPVRVSRGGEVLCPNAPTDPIQFIDVRDLAQWLLLLAERNTVGVFNAVGQAPPVTIGALVEASKKLSKSDARCTWASAEFLAEQKVSPWGDMPVWVPSNDPEDGGMSSINFGKAVKAGLTFRTVEQTVADTLAWWPKEVERRRRVAAEMVAQAEKDGKPKPDLPDPAKLRAGISPEREGEVLAAWRQKNK